MEPAKKAKQVLIVEDDAELATIVANALNESGFEATHVTSAREASFKLKSIRFSCVLLDMNLGKETGENVIHIARNPKLSENARTPILMMSGTLDKESLVKIAPYIKGVLVKPFGIDALLELVNKHCGQA
jgi:DNA-binding response OmpR family regulator